MVDNVGGFTPAEVRFLRDQPLARLATLTSSGDPVVVPMSFRLVSDGTIVMEGHGLEHSAKWRHIGRDPRVSLVVDEGMGAKARGVLVRGTASLITVEHGGPLIRLRPRRVVGWGLDTSPYERAARDV